MVHGKDNKHYAICRLQIQSMRNGSCSRLAGWFSWCVYGVAWSYDVCFYIVYTNQVFHVVLL